MTGFPPVPAPHDLDAGLRWRASGSWYACGPPPTASQGLKLYVSATPRNFAAILRDVTPLLVDVGVHFKYVRSVELLRRLNSGTFGYSQIGKCLVVYLQEPSRQLVSRLARVLAAYRHASPAVPLARHLGDGLPLHYRFGSYVDDQIEIDGRWRADVRDDREAAIPAGVDDTLRDLALPDSPAPDLRRFLLRYPVFEAIQQQGKFGTFRALDLSSETFREIVLKFGYPNGQVQEDGSDGCTFLRREVRFYRRLRERGLASVAPGLVDAYDDGTNVVVVLERLPGHSLLRLLLEGDLLPWHLQSCWQVLTDVHAKGLYLGDAKIANFMATRDDPSSVRAIDFETAGVLGEDPPARAQTFRVTRPTTSDAPTTDQLHFLASVVFPYEQGNYDAEHRTVDLIGWSGHVPDSPVSSWVHQTLRSTLAAHP